MDVFEYETVLTYLKSHHILKEYKKAKGYITEGHYQQVQLKNDIRIPVVFGILELRENIVPTPKKNKTDLSFLKSLTINKTA